MVLFRKRIFDENVGLSMMAARSSVAEVVAGRVILRFSKLRLVRLLAP
jgi:hypothetical protein